MPLPKKIYIASGTFDQHSQMQVLYKCTLKKMDSTNATLLISPSQKRIPVAVEKELSNIKANLAANDYYYAWYILDKNGRPRFNLIKSDLDDKISCMNISVNTRFNGRFQYGAMNDDMNCLYITVKHISMLTKCLFPNIIWQNSKFVLFQPNGTLYDLRDKFNPNQNFFSATQIHS